MEKKNNSGLIAIIIVLVIALLGVCFYVAYDKGLIFNNKEEVEEKEEENNEIKVVSDETLNILLTKIGSTNGMESIEIGNPLSTFNFVDGAGVVTRTTKILGEQSVESKMLFLYFYLLNNDMIVTVSGDEYTNCQYGSGNCTAVSIETANAVAQNLLNEDSNMFSSLEKYNNMYIFTYGGWTMGPRYISNNFSADYDSDGIVVLNEASILTTDNQLQDNLKIKYNFKLNSNNEYYLYSIAVE